MFKVPFRMIYCDTIWDWLKETAWCFVVLKMYPHTVYLPPIDGHPEFCPWCLGEYKSPMEQVNKFSVLGKSETTV